MIVRKLRLERGWSQEQLAQISGLNIRTIQRIESGQKAGLESLKCLAAVFEIDISALTPQQQESPMDTTNTPETINDQPQIAKMVRAKVLTLALRFSVIIAFLWAINLATYPQYLWALFPTLAMVFVVLYVGASALIPDSPHQQKLLDKLDRSMSGEKSNKKPKRTLQQIRLKLLLRLVHYLLIIALLFTINVIFTPSYMWAWWPTLGMSIGFVSECIKSLSKHMFMHETP